MIKTSYALLLLCASAGCLAQNPSAATIASSAKHYRLTFVVTYPNKSEPSQSFSLDVPVLPGAPGVSAMNFVSSSGNDASSVVQRNIQCTDVHNSASGVAANVSITFDSRSSPTQSSNFEPVLHHFVFQKKIDVSLGATTVITEPMHFMKLNKGVATEAPMPTSAVPPQVSVTATEI